MNFKTAFQDSDRAVSPVIGVILMVAITVILAAVIGTFVLGIGDQLADATPQASYDIDDADATNDQIELTKTGGQDLAFSDLRVVVDVEDKSAEFDLANVANADGDNWRTADTAVIDTSSGTDTTFTVRNSDTISVASAITLEAGDEVTITIIHKPSGGAVSEPSSTA